MKNIEKSFVIIVGYIHQRMRKYISLNLNEVIGMLELQREFLGPRAKETDDAPCEQNEQKTFRV